MINVDVLFDGMDVPHVEAKTMAVAIGVEDIIRAGKRNWDRAGGNSVDFLGRSERGDNNYFVVIRVGGL